MHMRASEHWMRCSRVRREDAFAAACGRNLLYVRRNMVCTTGSLPAFFGRWKRKLRYLPAAACASHGVGRWAGYAVRGGRRTLLVLLQSTCYITDVCVGWSGSARTRVAFHLFVASSMSRRTAKGI